MNNFVAAEAATCLGGKSIVGFWKFLRFTCHRRLIRLRCGMDDELTATEFTWAGEDDTISQGERAVVRASVVSTHSKWTFNSRAALARNVAPADRRQNHFPDRTIRRGCGSRRSACCRITTGLATEKRERKKPVVPGKILTSPGRCVYSDATQPIAVDQLEGMRDGAKLLKL
jgi:hypothetical protein